MHNLTTAGIKKISCDYCRQENNEVYQGFFFENVTKRSHVCEDCAFHMVKEFKELVKKKYR